LDAKNVPPCIENKKVDDTANPAQHLNQWETYFVFRKKQAAINLPGYFIALNLTMGLYFIEVLSGRPVSNVIILLAVYAAWMVFGYFYIGKKNLKKEDKRLQSIIDELKSIVKDLKEQE
jgi:hypothetical protein